MVRSAVRSKLYWGVWFSQFALAGRSMPSTGVNPPASGTFASHWVSAPVGADATDGSADAEAMDGIDMRASVAARVAHTRAGREAGNDDMVRLP
ncbi:hypothetical protein GCM10009780_03570 [Actinomadura alba]